MKIVAKKMFGQNFLIDNNVINNIVKSAKITKKSLVIEIGPGMGALTKLLVKEAKYVLAYEIDYNLVDYLKEEIKDNNLTIINQDILKANISEDIKKFNDYDEIIMIGNLPYYITTPIILGLLEKNLKINRYIFMIQDEVAMRLTSKPQTKDYNALSVLIQYKTKASKLFMVKNTSFNPAPKVNSAVIELIPFEYPLKPKNEKLFYQVNRVIFKQRRKTLKNNLKEFNLNNDKINTIYNELHLKEAIRAEELSVDDIINLSDKIGEKND